MQADVLVIGSEGAGARAAIEASKSGASVLLVTKGRLGKSGSTVTAHADINVDGNSIARVLNLEGQTEDSKEMFFEDTIIEGKYLNDQRLVEILVDNAPTEVKNLLDKGMKVTKIYKTPGHRFPRGVFTSGREIVRALKRWVKSHKITLLEDTMVCELITFDGAVVGAVGIHLASGKILHFKVGAVILATGGGMQMFPVQTAPTELTGDGHAMALRAGAKLISMEMLQFMPVAFIAPPAWRGVNFPFAIGPSGALDAWLLNRHGERFMLNVDPVNKEKTTRDLLTRGIMTEVVQGRGGPLGGVYFSLAHLPYNLVDYLPEWHGKPNLTTDWHFQGFDFSTIMDEMKKGYAIEVGPASHFFMGGIKIEPDCSTGVPGLFAAGEVAGGLHGANRLSGNACTQMLVQGAIAGRSAADYALKRKNNVFPSAKHLAEIDAKIMKPINNTNNETNAFEVKHTLQRLAWDWVGPARYEQGLQKALQQVKEIRSVLGSLSSRAKNPIYNREWVECLQVENLVMLLEAAARSALLRQESRGAHFRLDYPELDSKWLKNIEISFSGENCESNWVPVNYTSIKPGGNSNE